MLQLFYVNFFFLVPFIGSWAQVHRKASMAAVGQRGWRGKDAGRGDLSACNRRRRPIFCPWCTSIASKQAAWPVFGDSRRFLLRMCLKIMKTDNFFPSLLCHLPRRQQASTYAGTLPEYQRVSPGLPQNYSPGGIWHTDGIRQWEAQHWTWIQPFPSYPAEITEKNQSLIELNKKQLHNDRRFCKNQLGKDFVI